MDNSLRQWLRHILIPYNQPERLFRDLEALLATYPSLSCKTDSFAFEDGTTKVLLCLNGTIPISFRQLSYNIPLAIWIPTSYPTAPPNIFVEPTKDMLVKPGEYVDLSRRVNHPYLSYWSSRSEQSNLLEIATILQSVFSQAPPLYTKPATTASIPHAVSNPPAFTTTSTTPITRSHQQQRVLNKISAVSTSSMQKPPYSSPSSSSPSAQTPPNQPRNSPNHNHSPAPTPFPSTSTNNPPSQSSSNNNNNNISRPLPPVHLSPSNTVPSVSSVYPQLPIRTGSNPNLVPPWSSSSRTADPALHLLPRLQMELSKKLSSKMLLYNSEMTSRVEELLVANKGLNEGEIAIESDRRLLTDIQAKAKTNVSNLENKLKEIDACLEIAAKEAEPSLDELVVGSTAVYQQLFDLVADEHAIEDTVYYLGQAMIKGERMDLTTYLKHIRVLSREQFLRRALIHKIRCHTGLDDHVLSL